VDGVRTTNVEQWQDRGSKRYPYSHAHTQSGGAWKFCKGADVPSFFYNYPTADK